MEIRYIKNKSVLIKGKKEAVLVDPTEDVLKEAGSTARIVAYTKDGEKHWQSESEGRVVLTGPGEYEVGGVEVRGYGANDGGTLYIMVVDGITVAYVGGLKETLTDKRIERIGGIDVLVYSIAKENALPTKEVESLAKKMGANYLIPVGIDIKDEVMVKFLDESDNEGLESVETLKIDKDSLPDGLEVVAIWTK